jgi:hypothetical protein
VGSAQLIEPEPRGKVSITEHMSIGRKEKEMDAGMLSTIVLKMP